MDAQGVPISGDQAWTNPAWRYLEEYPAGSVIELRIHGVGGESPSGMTRDPHPRNVGGDSLAGFWRARNPVVCALDDERLHVREVLSWGGQTSGTTRHAFWVLLLPFAFFNVAGRMHPSKESRARLYRAVARALAYTMTLSVLGLVAATAYDVLARAVTDGIGAGKWWLAPLRYFRDPVQRIGFVTLLPAAALLGLWGAGRYKTSRLEGYPPEHGTTADHEPIRLDDEDFWRNEWTTSRLRSAHATGGFAFIAATLALVLSGTDVAQTPGRLLQRHGALWSAVVALSVAVAIVAGLIATSSRTVRPGRNVVLHHTLLVLRFLALGALVTEVVLALQLRPVLWLRFPLQIAGAAFVARWASTEIAKATKERARTGISTNIPLALGVGLFAAGLFAETSWVPLPQTTFGRIPTLFSWLPDGLATRIEGMAPNLHIATYFLLLPLIIVQIVLLLAMLATGLQRSFPPRANADPAGYAFPFNSGGIVVALLALLQITAVGASIHALMIQLAGTRTGDPTQGFVLPWWYALTAWVVAFGFPLILGITFGVRWLLRAKAASFFVPVPAPDDVAAELNRGPGGPGSLRSAALLGRVGKLWLTQRLLRDAGVMLATTVGVAALSVVGFFVVVAASERVSLRSQLPLTSLAVWVITALAGASVGFIRSNLRDKARQRHVGVLWDVLCFWPRVTHPFAPPCYGEAVVPMLCERIATWRAKDLNVVLAGHSQGSVVALATLQQAHATPHLVTYGSPIVVLYERFFPAVFGGPKGAIAKGERRSASWHHMFAMTEPFAMPFWSVQSASDDDRRSGWERNKLLRHPDQACPVCGWESPEAVRQRGGAPAGATTAHCTDFVVSDPSRWAVPADSCDPKPRGHSTYHDSLEVDAHIERIAART